MISAQSTKRFIAGAVCPRCGQQDKLMMYTNEDKQQVRECVRCHYQDVMTDEGPQELTTRVNQLRPGEKPIAYEDDVQLVNIVDLNPGAKQRNH